MKQNISRHRNILLKILKDIYTDTILSSVLGFKGGTALYFFYGLDRFSVDLDFDLLDSSKEQLVFEQIDRLILKYGTIKQRINKKHTIFFLLSYDKESWNIKLEINKRNFGSKYEIKNYLGISMLVMKIEDMFAHKLVAITERKTLASRDIYDIYFFLQDGYQVNKEIVEKRTGMNFKDYIKKCISYIEKMPETRILSGIGDLLSEEKKKWIKGNLKREVIFLLRLLLDSE